MRKRISYLILSLLFFVSISIITTSCDGGSNENNTSNASEGLEFSLLSDESGYKLKGIGSCADVDIIIPSSYNGKPVTSIGLAAFQNCTNITNIDIPTSVTSIGYGAFTGCSSLESITIPNSVTSIGGQAFANCSSLKSITLSSNITSIGNLTFYYCTSLTSITIPEGVNTMEVRAFYTCTSLTSITIPDSVTSIGSEAFFACRSLTNVYYTGSSSDWSNITIDSNNSCLTSATITYNYVG